MTVNKRVENCGFRFMEHFNCTELVCNFDDCQIVIDPKRLREFLDVFDLAYKDCFLHEVSGKLCRMIYDEKYHVFGIQHILHDNTCYYKNIEEKNNEK